MPTTTRAAIVRKSDLEYVGYIGIQNTDGKNQSADLKVQTTNDKKDTTYDLLQVVDVYLTYLKNSLNIKNINPLKKDEDLKKVDSVIQLPKKFLKDSVSEKELEIVKSWGINVPRLSYSRAVCVNNKFVGVIGLSNLNHANKRADLKIFLNPNLGQELLIEFGAIVIDEYLEFAHELNIYNVASDAVVSSTEENMLNESKMQKFGEIPYVYQEGNNLVSKALYQHTPNIETKDIEILNVDYSRTFDNIRKTKTELSPIVKLDDSYSLVRPSFFKEFGIDFDNIINGHILAMQNREKFTIPLGEDKYFLQYGNEKYGIYKSVMNFSYVVVDKEGNYAGYVNILRTTGKNAEIEIGISPNLQAKGLGKKVVETFYKELFSLGFASVTSTVFEFNKPSLKLHDKVAELNGIRLNSYYINGHLWNMHYYSSINPDIKVNKDIKKK